MEPTPRDELPYDDADLAEATRRLRAICADLPEVEVAGVVEESFRCVAPVPLVRHLSERV